MDTIYIDVAPLDAPENLKRICVRDNTTLKAFIDQVSSTLNFEVYGLYLNNKRLIDVNQLTNYCVVFATSTCSPEQSIKDFEKDDSDEICDDDTFFTEEQNSIKAVVLGEDGSGKSAFTFRFVYNMFVTRYSQNSIATEYTHSLKIDGMEYGVSILDATDKYIEDYSDNWMRDRNMFIITVDVSQLHRWEVIVNKYLTMLKNVSAVHTIILVTKIDLIESMSTEKKKNVNDFMTKLKIFASKRNIAVIKTSAKVNKKIDHPFILASKRLRSFRLRISSLRDNFETLYDKEPFVFKILNNFVDVCKKKLCHG